ncbi:MAG: DUF2516 family protein [Dehalococcoidia bacterium]
MPAPIALLFQVLSFATIGLTVFAFVDAAMRPQASFVAADKQNKQFWLIILGLAALWILFFSWYGIIGLLGVIAAIVYVVDVRPAVRSLGRGGSGQSGPYGRW